MSIHHAPHPSVTGAELWGRRVSSHRYWQALSARVHVMFGDRRCRMTPAVAEIGRDRRNFGIGELPAKRGHGGGGGFLLGGNALGAFEDDSNEGRRIPGCYGVGGGKVRDEIGHPACHLIGDRRSTSPDRSRRRPRSSGSLAARGVDREVAACLVFEINGDRIQIRSAQVGTRIRDLLRHGPGGGRKAVMTLL